MAIEYAGAYDASAIPPDIAREIEIYEIQLDRFQAGQVEEATFTEFRLRRGVYGQRDDRSQMIRVKNPVRRTHSGTTRNARRCCRRNFRITSSTSPPVKMYNIIT